MEDGAEHEEQVEEQVGVRPPFVRVFADGPTSKSCRIELVEPNDDGDVVSEIPFVRRAVVTLEASKENRVDLEVLTPQFQVPAEIVRLREIVLPPPADPKIVVSVFEPCRRWFGLRRSRVTVQRHTPAGVSGVIVETLADGWTSASAAAVFNATEVPR